MAEQPRNIADIRMDYMLAALDEQTAGSDPVLFFEQWFIEADNAQISEVNAMTLATVDATHKPHARIVLLKGIDERGLSFFTNYNSAKGTDISHNQHVAVLFFWKELERQVRIEGVIEKLPPAESDDYFLSRPVGSRIGAWSSPQSQEIPNRTILDENYAGYEAQFAGNVPRPPHWGGYLIVPTRFEFWQGRSSRMHDRILFRRDGAGGWQRSRLAP